jgi:AcrR family transcriptional regulator
VERWTPERRRQRTREALLDAAAVVFAQRGFQGASLDEIAATAGYTRGAIYKHFADKEDLLHEVCVRVNERSFAEIDELPSTYASFERFDAAEIAEHWRSMNERDADVRIVMLEFLLHAARNPELRERARHFARANLALVTEYIRQRAVEVGEDLPLPAEDLAQIFANLADGFGQMSLIDPEGGRLIGVAIDLVLRGVRHLRDEQHRAPD